jgi:hypothetical protein
MHRVTIVDPIVEKPLESIQVDPSSTFGAAANPELTEISTADTALSLDGKGSTGQSVGQQCMNEV